ncbi:MAG: TonB-dependent receptor [Bacteroidales bacterium]|nr:TonB-dependent receptor [Bacteroidales bacterium]
MRKNYLEIVLTLPKEPKTFLIMKFILLFATLASFNLSANVYSQDTRLDLSVQEKTLKEVLKIIESKSNFRFFFSDNFHDLNRKISMNVSNGNISQIMSYLLDNSAVTFELMENGIIVITPNEAQQHLVTGRVTDQKTGEPLPGVNVVVKGTSTGTITDFNGNYVIQADSPDEILQFSFVGYLTREVEINNQSSIDIMLTEDIAELEEVVVIGYGIQKKVNLTGSVSSVTSEEITRRPVPNPTNLLQGKMSGLQITQGTGQPGRERNDILIRGRGSYGSSSSPLILVDGIIGSMDYLNPEDIESVSVLKDAASAAIYGARAANGVILVTTKTGKAEPVRISYSNNFAAHNATSLPELIYNSAETMEMWNAAAVHSSNAIRFTEAEIEAYREGQYTDPLQYPNFNWVDFMFRTGFVQNHHLGISGGNERVTFNTSFSMVDQDGILPGHEHQRYTANLNLKANINDWISLGTGLMLSQRNTSEPTYANDAFVLMVFGMQGLQMPYLPDGSERYSARAYPKLWQNRNPLAVANEWSKTYLHYNIRPQINLEIKPLNGLVWSTKAAVNFDPTYEKIHEYPLESYYYQKVLPDDEDYRYAHDQWPNNQGVRQENNRSNLYTLFSTLQYSRTFGNHDMNVLGGYSQEYRYYEEMMAFRQNFPIYTLPYLDVGSEDVWENTGTSNEWAIQSLFGRVNYAYKGKYLAEANFRYDGTSRIHKDYRWGFFPSFSAAWRVSNEEFTKNLGWLDNMKLRVSYGELGNQEIPLYPYQNYLDLTSYSFGSNTLQGAYVTRLTDQSIRWESTTVFDIGLDYSMKRGLLSFVVDWYKKETNDILYQQEIPASVGLDPPTVNYGSMQNAGIDLELGHRHSVGDFKWEITGIYSAYRNKVLKLLATDYTDNDTRINQEGLPWGSFYLYEWIGIFQSPEDIANSPAQPHSPQPGDLKFRDLDTNGVINSDDRMVFDGAFPDFSWSLNSRFEWKGFDLTIFLQGVQGRKLYVINWGISPFTQAGPPPVKWRNAWTPENQTNEMPALYVEGYAPNTLLRNTFNLQDASYLRIKNINLGYTIPRDVCSKIRLDYLRVYVAVDNLFTFTKYEGLDPERMGNTNFAQYPQVRVLSAGLNLTF